MSKSRPKGYGQGNWYEGHDDYAYWYVDKKETQEHRRSKRMKNIIRSKDINRLLELEEDDLEDSVTRK